MIPVIMTTAILKICSEPVDWVQTQAGGGLLAKFQTLTNASETVTYAERIEITVR